MSNLPPLIDLRESRIESIQNVTFIEASLIDQNDIMRVNICHHLTEQQIRKMEQMNKNLLKLIDSKKNHLEI